MAFVTSKDKLVQLTYSFMFSRRDNIWNNITEFEHDLDKFLMSKGLEAEVITFVEGSSGHRTLFLRDVSKEQTLRNDKTLSPLTLPSAKPSASYKMVNKLSDSVGKGKGK
jgi:hypothetical protein